MSPMHADSTTPRKLRLGSSRALKGAALVVALLEAIAAHAKPQSESLRVNARNTPIPGGDAYDTGRGLLAAGDVIGAMAAFREALLAAPQSIDTLNAIGVCYDRLGRYDVSRSYYDSALAIAPDSVLVLNNLGYSLYLQGDLRGAIPFLQQAAAASDPQAAATSRRLLQLISFKLRDGEARASMAQAVAELKSQSAHIELAANGEQRLVLAAPAPRPEVVATLGEAAALTVAPKTWTARDEKRLVAQDAALARAETAAVLAEVATLTAADAALKASPTLELAKPSATTAITVAFPVSPAAITPVTVAVAMPVAARPAMAFTPAIAMAPTPAPVAKDGSRTETSLAMAETPAPARSKNSAKATTKAARAERKAAGSANSAPVAMAAHAVTGQLVASAFGYANVNLEAPGWLVASRREAAAGAPRLVGQSPDIGSAIAGFDSDDPVLNAFAARMRGAVNDNRPVEVATDVAISRLEALIARLRRA